MDSIVSLTLARVLIKCRGAWRLMHAANVGLALIGSLMMVNHLPRFFLTSAFYGLRIRWACDIDPKDLDNIHMARQVSFVMFII